MSAMKITKNNFEQEVLKSHVPVLLDFWAPWCGPCRMVAPVIEEIAQEKDGKVKVCKINVDEEMELAQSFGIASIPTLMVFRDGIITNKTIGFSGKAQLVAMLGV